MKAVLMLVLSLASFTIMGAALSKDDMEATLIDEILIFCMPSTVNPDRFARFKERTHLPSPLLRHGFRNRPKIYFSLPTMSSPIEFSYSASSPELKEEIAEFVKHGDGKRLLEHMMSRHYPEMVHEDARQGKKYDDEMGSPQRQKSVEPWQTKLQRVKKLLRRKTPQARACDENVAHSVDPYERSLGLALMKYYLSTDWLAFEAFCVTHGLDVKRGVHFKDGNVRILLNPAKDLTNRVVIDLHGDEDDKDLFSIAVMGDAQPVYDAMRRAANAFGN